MSEPPPDYSPPFTVTVPPSNQDPPVYTSFSTNQYGMPEDYTNQGFSNDAAYLVTSFDDRMGLAIIATLCCFWPLGIVAILKSSQARKAMASHDILNAQRLAMESRRMSKIAIVIGAFLFVIIVNVVLAIGLSHRNS